MNYRVVPAPHTPTRWERIKGRFLQGSDRIAQDAEAGAGPVVLLPFIGGNPLVRWIAPRIGRAAMWLIVAILLMIVVLLGVGLMAGR